MEPYTKLSNAFFAALSKYSPSDAVVYWAISRRTIGWHKEEDVISCAQLCADTGLSENSVRKSILILIKDGWITRNETGQSFSYSVVCSTPSIFEDEPPQNLREQEADTLKICGSTPSKIEDEPPQNLRTQKKRKKNKEKDLNSALMSGSEGKPSLHSEVRKIFEFFSEKKDGVTYYHNAREAANIKQLEPRYKQDSDGFKALVEKYYEMTQSGADFWCEQPLTPSAFNSLYNRIVAFKIKQQPRKDTNEEFIMRNFGTATDERLADVVERGLISASDMAYIQSQRIPS